MNRESMRLLISKSLHTTSKKIGRVNLLMRPNWQKDFTNFGRIFMIIMMRASRNIIHKRLEAVVEPN